VSENRRDREARRRRAATKGEVSFGRLSVTKKETQDDGSYIRSSARTRASSSTTARRVGPESFDRSLAAQDKRPMSDNLCSPRRFCN